MKTLFYILLTVGSVIIIAYLLAGTAKLIVDLTVATAVISGSVALVRYGLRKHHERTHPLRLHARAEKTAERALKEMERTVNKQ